MKVAAALSFPATSKLSHSDKHEQNSQQNAKTDKPEAKNVQSAAADDTAIDITDEDKKEEEKLRLRDLPSRSKLVLVLLSLANFLAGCGYSLLAPFFPQEAEKKGVSETVTGLIFSTFDFVIFLSSPIFGNYLTRLGVRFMFFTGIFVGGTCAILFGLLDRSPPGTSFTVICFFCRCTEALALSSFITSSFAIITNEFSQHVATVFGMMETANGLGMMVGPAIGGLLYELGGYGLPFFVIGSLIILCGLVSFKLLPHPEDAQKERKGSVWMLLKSVEIWVAMLSIITAAVGISFLDPTLSSHLEKFHLSTALIGLVFVIAPGLYAATAPMWGYLSDKRNIVAPLIIFGSVTCGAGFLFIGPTPLLPFLPYELWVNIIGAVLIGLSIGCAIVPTMKCMVDGALQVGFEDNLDTYAIVSGFFNSVFCLGGFTGPTLGGVLVQHLKFEYAATVISGIFFISALFSIAFFSPRFIKKKWRQGRSREYEVLEPAEDDSSSGAPQSLHNSHRESLTGTHSIRDRRLSGGQGYVRSMSHP